MRGSIQPAANHWNVSLKEPDAGHLVHVVVRLVDGDRVFAGSAADSAEAHRIAEGLLTRFAQAGATWPLVDDRYLRPDAVVSIDVVPEEHRRWGGSAERAKIMDTPVSGS